MAERLDLEAVKRRHAEGVTIPQFTFTSGAWCTVQCPQAHNDRDALISEVEALREALRQVAHPMATFAGPQCCADTFADACELFSDIARAVLPETETEEK